MGVLGGGWTMESGGGQGRGGWIKESVNLVSVGGWVCVCVGILSVCLGPGLDSMSPARSRRSVSHAAGTHGWLPKKTGRPGLRRGGVGGYNLHSVPPNSPPDCGTVAHQPRAGCIRLVRSVPSSKMSTASPPAVHVPVATNTYKQRTTSNVVRTSSNVPMATTVTDNNNNTWQVPKKHVQALKKP